MASIDKASAPAAPTAGGINDQIRSPRSDRRGHWWNLPAVAVIVIGLGVRPGSAQICVGDCNGNHMVIVNELVECVNIALNIASLDTCSACSSDQHTVTISNLVTAVNNALNGCPAMPTPTSTGLLDTPTASATPTPTAMSGPCLGKPEAPPATRGQTLPSP